MGQITEAFAQQMLDYADAGQHAPLTVWEEKQLVLAWLAIRASFHRAAVLIKFYGVNTVDELVEAQADHVEKLLGENECQTSDTTTTTEGAGDEQKRSAKCGRDSPA